MKKIIVAILVITVISASLGTFGSTVNEDSDDCGCQLNSTSSLTTTEPQKVSKYALGWIKDDLNELPEPVTLSGNPPQSWDWRNINGENWVTPIRNQGECGSCWAFGAIAAVETIYNYQNNDPTLDIDLSEQYMVSCGMKHYSNSLNGCCGGHMSATLDFLRTRGTVEESYFTYQGVDADGRDIYDCGGLGTHTPVKCKRVDAPKYKIKTYNRILDTESIKNAIHNYGPVVAGFDVYADFFDYSEGIYEKQSDKYCGGHIVAIVGYDNTESCWICKNSWGTEWGENGYFRIKYGECRIDDLGNCYYFTSCIKAKSMNNFDLNIILNQFPLLKNLFASILFSF